MSAEVYFKNPDNEDLVIAVGESVAKVLVATGESTADIATTGLKAARYAAELLLSTLEMLGEVQPGNAADEHFIEMLHKVTEATVDPENSELIREDALFEQLTIGEA